MVPSSRPATILALFGSLALLLAQALTDAHVVGEKWWVTASVAVGAALLGSGFGAVGLYYASVVLERRRRKALAEIRRKAKVYTPIREELIALRRAIAEDRHLSEGVRLKRSDHQWPRDTPLLVIWREFVDDGRANTTASPSVREALKRVEGATDVFNLALKTTQSTFEECGNAIVEQSGFTPDYPGQLVREFETLYRHGVRAARIFRIYPGPSNPHRDVSPLTSVPETPTPEQGAFVTLWEADEAVREVATKLGEAERGLDKAAESAIAVLDAAMKRRDANERVQAALVIDEAHNVFIPAFATLLSEGRSGGIEVAAAFQYTGQIVDERVRTGVRGLLQNVSIFRQRDFQDARAAAALAMEVFQDNIRGDTEDQRRIRIDPMDIEPSCV